MTSVGCGLLLLGLCLLGAVAIAEQIGVPFLRGWPYLLVGGLGVFLLLQLLLLVFRGDDAREMPSQCRSRIRRRRRPRQLADSRAGKSTRATWRIG